GHGGGAPAETAANAGDHVVEMPAPEAALAPATAAAARERTGSVLSSMTALPSISSQRPSRYTKVEPHRKQPPSPAFPRTIVLLI
ncbi:MAG: hypothetical protein ACREQ9_05575, partial [Candidatus Binatia bacterium]